MKYTCIYENNNKKIRKDIYLPIKPVVNEFIQLDNCLYRIWRIEYIPTNKSYIDQQNKFNLDIWNYLDLKNKIAIKTQILIYCHESGIYKKDLEEYKYE